MIITMIWIIITLLCPLELFSDAYSPKRWMRWCVLVCDLPHWQTFAFSYLHIGKSFVQSRYFLSCPFVSVCLSVPFLWTRCIRNTWGEFHYIWHGHPLGLKDELSRIYWSNVKVIVTSPNTFQVASSREGTIWRYVILMDENVLTIWEIVMPSVEHVLSIAVLRSCTGASVFFFSLSQITLFAALLNVHPRDTGINQSWWNTGSDADFSFPTLFDWECWPYYFS